MDYIRWFNGLCSVLDVFVLEIQSSQIIHAAVDTDGPNFIIIIIKIIVCACLCIMQFYLRALVWSIQTFYRTKQCFSDKLGTLRDRNGNGDGNVRMM